MDKKTLAAIVMLTIVGFALRVYGLSDVPFRGDEAFTAQNWAGLPLAESIRTIATLEPHPPLTYALFRAWGLTAGINEFTMRLLPTFINLLGIPTIYLLGKHLGNRRIGLLAALLWAVNPYQIWHAQDARNYAIWSGLSMIGMWLGLRVIERGRRADWLLYGVMTLFTGLVFYFELFTIGALSLFALIVRWRDWRFLARWVALQVMVAGSILLVFVILQAHLFTGEAYGGTIAGFDPWWWLTWFLPTLTFGETLPRPLQDVLWPVTLILVVGGGWLWWRRDRQSALFVGLVTVIPLLLLGIVSLKVEIFHPRYAIVAASGFLLLFAGLVIRLSQMIRFSWLRQSVTLVLVGGWLAVSGYSLANHYWNMDYAKSKAWPDLTAYLRNNVSADDLVIQTGVDAAFGYYYDAPAVDTGLPKDPEQTEAEIVDQLEKSAALYRSLWVVGSTFDTWPNAGIVENWTQTHMQAVRTTATDGLPIREFLPWDVPNDEIRPETLAVFEDVAELVGVHVFAPEPSDELTIWLYWRPVATSAKPLKVFVHLRGDTNPATGGPLWSQDDRFPQNGRVSTDSWSSDQIYRDVYVVPLANVPPGTYEVVVGFYDPVTNDRVAVAGEYSFVIGHVTLKSGD